MKEYGFKGFYPGKEYKTRNGRKAILVRFDSTSICCNVIYQFDNDYFVNDVITYNLDGTTENSAFDIVGEWNETNVFKNASFGKLYRTRDGLKAVYLCTTEDEIERVFFHRVVIDCNDAYPRSYYDNGRQSLSYETSSDIVGEW